MLEKIHFILKKNEISPCNHGGLDYKTVLITRRRNYPKYNKEINMKFKSVIFDFNGTLFWDTKIHNQAWDIFLAKHDIMLTDNEKNRKIHGRNNYDIIISIFNKNMPFEEANIHILEKESIYREICIKNNLTITDDVIKFLDFLKSKNILFTIATASGPENVFFYFEYLELNRWFDINKIIYNDGSIKGKPDPEIFIKAIKIIGADTNKTIIFEDSYSGITAAERSGAGKIIIVNSTDSDYSSWNYQIIKNFNEIDRNLFV
jgi:beta-phosphoglucomutase